MLPALPFSLIDNQPEFLAKTMKNVTNTFEKVLPSYPTIAEKVQKEFNDELRRMHKENEKEFENVIKKTKGMIQKTNGRVDLLSNPVSSGSLKDLHSGKQILDYSVYTYDKDVTKTLNLNENILASLFFSPKNIEILQFGIKNRILNWSKGQYAIDDQSEIDLLIVMRSVYSDNARHENGNIVQQVKSLNTLVLEYCVDNVQTHILQHLNYVNDVSTIPELLDRPINISERRGKDLEFKY